MGCGHQNNKNYRCVICNWDAKAAALIQKKAARHRRFDTYSESNKGQFGWSKDFGPMITLGPKFFHVLPDIFHMKVNIPRMLFNAVKFPLLLKHLNLNLSLDIPCFTGIEVQIMRKKVDKFS